MAKQWYVVHAYSNFENKVKASLEEHARLAGMEDMFGQILIPTEEVVEIRDGAKRRSEMSRQKVLIWRFTLVCLKTAT